MSCRHGFAGRTLGLFASLAAFACGGGAPPPERAHPEHGHDPLVHRFEHAEKWAKEFDDPARDAWQKPEDVVAAMEIAPGMTVADVGAGTGYFEPWLSRAVGPSGSVLALDIEPDMVRYLGERAAREHLSNVKASLVATDDPKLGDASIDRVLVVDTWHHVPAREAYAAKLFRAMKPGGRVVVVDFTAEAKHGPPRHHRLPAEAVARELAAGGFVTKVAAPVLPEQYVVIGTRP